MTTLATYFAGILAGLRSLALRTSLPDRAAAEGLFALSAYLIRAAARMQRLHARWQAGRLRPRAAPPARVAPGPIPAPPHKPAARPRPIRRKAWLRRVLGPDAGNFGTQITHMLLRPDMPAFLAAAPQAGRILRPLLHLLGTDIPDELALPPRRCPPHPAARCPRAPRPGPARPPEPHHGKYSPRAMRRYRPGRIPNPVPFPKSA